MQNPIAEPRSAGIKALEADRQVSDTLLEVLDVFLSHETDAFTNDLGGVTQGGVDDADIALNLVLYIQGV